MTYFPSSTYVVLRVHECAAIAARQTTQLLVIAAIFSAVGFITVGLCAGMFSQAWLGRQVIL
jgi:hypothetical protein